MNWIIVDLDCTLIDTKELVASGGPEPTPGTPAHEAWIAHVTNPEILKSAAPVMPIFNLVHALEHAVLGTKVIFITNRRESMRELTKRWLHSRELFYPLFMRHEGDLRPAGEFKGNVIKHLIDERDSVLVIDDDPDGSIQRVCLINGWTHLKVTT
jgi:hypothetical protein